jgi:hypothetical protein
MPKPARKTVLRPLGLITTPNPYGQYPEGALSEALNCVIRSPGRLSAAPAMTNYTSIGNISGFSEVPYLLAPLDAGHVFTLTNDGSFWRIYEGVTAGSQTMGTLATFAGGGGLFLPARITSTRSRDRVLFNSTYGVMVADYMQPSSAAQRTLRFAGIPQPHMSLQSDSPSSGGAVPDGVMVGYSAIVTREFSDGYVVKSVPSCALKFLNTGHASPTTYSFYVSFPSTGVVAGDYVEMYRTDGLVTTAWTSDPGATFKLVRRYQLTATDITHGYAILTDSQILISPYYTTDGRELYTNPYQEGSNGANRQPDICQAMATFKGFTFYGNLTERAQWEFSVPAGINVAATNAPGSPRRASGLGLRTVTGTVTNGSPTVTGIAASNLVGIVPGQMHSFITPFPFGTTVLSVGASTITMSANATAGAASVTLNDVLEVNGDTRALLGNATVITFNGEITANQTISYDSAGDLPGTSFVIEPATPQGPSFGVQNITVRGTNGANYSPPIPEISQTVKTFSYTPISNLLRWSKDSEPEHVPSVNETRVGSGQIIAMATTKDALWIACSDGIYRLSGDGGVWRLDIVAPGTVLCSPRCMVNVRETIYAYTNLGFGAVTDSGFVPISEEVVRNLMPGVPFSENAAMMLGANPTYGEVLLHQSLNDYTYVYNTLTKRFTRLYDSNHLQYVSAMAWQENPASGAQVPLFALSEPSSFPAYAAWGDASNRIAAKAVFQPFYDKDPFVEKEWIDLCYLFNSGAVGSSVNIWMATDLFAQSVQIKSLRGGTEGQAMFGVTRKYALAPKIEPGFSNTSNPLFDIDFLGVSARYVPLTLQSGNRV